jgi:hypothetical protein
MAAATNVLPLLDTSLQRDPQPRQLALPIEAGGTQEIPAETEALVVCWLPDTAVYVMAHLSDFKAGRHGSRG